MFEAISCETLLVASNIALRSVIDPALLFDANSVESLADALLYALNMPMEKRQGLAHKYRAFVAREHSLASLAERFA